MKKKNGKKQQISDIASITSMKDALKRKASPEGEKRIQASANPKKPKSSLLSGEYLKEQARKKDIKRNKKKAKKKDTSRNNVEIVVNKDKKKPRKTISAKKPKDTLQDLIDEPTTASDNYKTSKKSKPKKLKTVDGDMLGGYGTLKDFPDKIVKNPFTGNDMTIEYSYPSSDDPDDNRKMGGKVRRRMGGKVRGYGKAQRGY